MGPLRLQQPSKVASCSLCCLVLVCCCFANDDVHTLFESLANFEGKRWCTDVLLAVFYLERAKRLHSIHQHVELAWLDVAVKLRVWIFVSFPQLDKKARQFSHCLQCVLHLRYPMLFDKQLSNSQNKFVILGCQSGVIISHRCQDIIKHAVSQCSQEH